MANQNHPLSNPSSNLGTAVDDFISSLSLHCSGGHYGTVMTRIAFGGGEVLSWSTVSEVVLRRKQSAGVWECLSDFVQRISAVYLEMQKQSQASAEKSEIIKREQCQAGELVEVRLELRLQSTAQVSGQLYTS